MRAALSRQVLRHLLNGTAKRLLLLQVHRLACMHDHSTGGAPSKGRCSGICCSRGGARFSMGFCPNCDADSLVPSNGTLGPTTAGGACHTHSLSLNNSTGACVLSHAACHCEQVCSICRLQESSLPCVVPAVKSASSAEAESAQWLRGHVASSGQAGALTLARFCSSHCLYDSWLVVVPAAQALLKHYPLHCLQSGSGCGLHAVGMR